MFRNTCQRQMLQMFKEELLWPQGRRQNIVWKAGKM
jgi:hypothetical protein